MARFLPYWHERDRPDRARGKQVIIAAHGNSLRALVKYLDGVSDDDIVELNIPTGQPLVYELDDASAADPQLLSGRCRGDRGGDAGGGQSGQGPIQLTLAPGAG